MCLIQAKPSQWLPRDGLHKADEAALCATSCFLWDPHFGAMTFCPQVPSRSRRKSSCSLSVLTDPNLASVIVTEQLLDVHRGEWNNRDVLALSPRLAPQPDFMAGEQELPRRRCCSSHTTASSPRCLRTPPLTAQFVATDSRTPKYCLS